MRLIKSVLSLSGSEEIRIHEDNKLELESVDVSVYLAARPPPHPTFWVDGRVGTSKTGLMINNVRQAFSWTLPSRLLCVWCRKKWAFGHKSVCKQQVFASKKTCSYWQKKAPHQSITKLYGVVWLLRNRGSCGRDGGRRVDSGSDGDRDSNRWQFLRVERFVTFSVFGVYS